MSDLAATAARYAQLDPIEEGDLELMEARLREACRIDPETLEDEFVRCPGAIAYWSARHALAIGAHLRAKGRAKKLRGLLFIEWHQTLEDLGRRPTVDAVNSEVDSDPRWTTAVEDETCADVEREKMKGAVAALIAKKDMLVQMGANWRAELERDPVIRERLHADRHGRRSRDTETG